MKNEKSLEVILEKINQNKVKELMDVKSADGKAAVRNGLLQASNGDLEARGPKKTESTSQIKPVPDGKESYKSGG